jgi:hypothetical protein
MTIQSDSLSTNQVYVSGGVKSLHGVKSINLSAPTFIKVYYFYFISIRVPITLLLHYDKVMNFTRLGIKILFKYLFLIK